MPLKLPNLDDRRYKDLMEEARGLIPTYAPDWTNHNPSDPGITLVELFAYLTEIMLYRANRVSGDNRKKFLKLLNGPGWTPGSDVVEDARQTVQGLRGIYRAVTCGDYETLITEQFNAWLAEMQRNEKEGKSLDEWWATTTLDSTGVGNLPSTAGTIARVRCVARRNLDAGTESGRLAVKPGHMSVIIVPDAEHGETIAAGPAPTEAQKRAVWAYLDGRRMLTTRHHVVGPLYAPVSVEGLVVQRADIAAKSVSDQMAEQIRDMLDPLPVAAKGTTGWPFGRDVYLSEVCEILENVQGVDYIPDLMLTSVCDGADDLCVGAETLWHDEGDQIGLAIPEHQLPSVGHDAVNIVVAPASKVVVITATIDTVLASSADPAIGKRKIKQAVRQFFHPLHEGPKQDAAADTLLTVAALQAALSGIAELQQINSIKMESDPSRCTYDGQGSILSIQVKAGEVVDARLRLNV